MERVMLTEDYNFLCPPVYSQPASQKFVTNSSKEEVEPPPQENIAVSLSLNDVQFNEYCYAGEATLDVVAGYCNSGKAVDNLQLHKIHIKVISGYYTLRIIFYFFCAFLEGFIEGDRQKIYPLCG
jgi:hypothetical protein